MNGARLDHVYLANAAPDQLAALVFELASQLHVERQRRIALEVALAHGGILTPDALDRAQDDKTALAKGRDALDHAVRRMVRIVSEHGDSRTPLRNECNEPP